MTRARGGRPGGRYGHPPETRDGGASSKGDENSSESYFTPRRSRCHRRRSRFHYEMMVYHEHARNQKSAPPPSRSRSASGGGHAFGEGPLLRPIDAYGATDRYACSTSIPDRRRGNRTVSRLSAGRLNGCAARGAVEDGHRFRGFYRGVGCLKWTTSLNSSKPFHSGSTGASPQRGM
jgi:hypothetical protein